MLDWREPVWAGMSLHERDEWLRLDGIRRFDPHEDSPDGSRFGVRPARDTGVGRVVSGLAARGAAQDPATRHWRADGRATPEPEVPPTPLRPSTPATPKTGPRRGRSGAAATMSAAGIAVATAPCACRSFRKPKAKAKPKRGKRKAAWKREPSRRRPALARSPSPGLTAPPRCSPPTGRCSCAGGGAETPTERKAQKGLVAKTKRQPGRVNPRRDPKGRQH